MGQIRILTILDSVSGKKIVRIRLTFFRQLLKNTFFHQNFYSFWLKQIDNHITFGEMRNRLAHQKSLIIPQNFLPKIWHGIPHNSPEFWSIPHSIRNMYSTPMEVTKICGIPWWRDSVNSLLSFLIVLSSNANVAIFYYRNLTFLCFR
jgi:hypothetical protein